MRTARKMSMSGAKWCSIQLRGKKKTIIIPKMEIRKILFRRFHNFSHFFFPSTFFYLFIYLVIIIIFFTLASDGPFLFNGAPSGSVPGHCVHRFNGGIKKIRTYTADLLRTQSIPNKGRGGMWVEKKKKWQNNDVFRWFEPVHWTQDTIFYEQTRISKKISQRRFRVRIHDGGGAASETKKKKYVK